MAKIYVPAPSLFQKFTNSDGKPLSRGYLYCYRAGTDELKDTYKDSFSLTLNTNPIRLDDEGFCNIFIYTSTDDTYDDAYRFELFDENHVMIMTTENITAVKGKDGEPYKVILMRGEQGKKGDDGKSIPGPVRTGPQGDTSDSGDFTVFWNVAGTYTWLVPEGCDKIKVKIQGAGGGIYLPKALPDCGLVYTGRAGAYTTATYNVTPGEVITVIVGKGGQATTNQLLAAGGASSIESTSIPKVTINGGSAGSNDGDGLSTMFQKLMPALTFYNVDGSIIQSVPRAVPGESSFFGQGGDIYSGNQGTGGNGASGGTGIPTIKTTGEIQISAYYPGGDGYVEIVYNTGE